MSVGWNLARLVSPSSEATFLKLYWDSEWWILHREEEDYYSSLLTVRDLDEILSTTGLRPPALRLVRNGEDIPTSRLATDSPIPASPSLDVLYEELRAGATVGLNFLQERHARLAALCRSLAESLACVAQVNAYITPPASIGLRPHYDDHDVFVLQIMGRKRWKVYRGGPVRPLRGQPFRPDTDCSYEVDEELELQPGDLLYLPRGTLHSAEGLDLMSVHLTVGVSTMTWADVVLQEVERVILSEPAFRASLPVDITKRDASDAASTLRLKVERLVSLIEVDGATRRTLRQIDAAGRDELSGQLVDLGRLDQLGPKTRCALRSGCRIDARQSDLVVRRNGKEVHLPLGTIEALRYAQQTPDFLIQDLPGLEDEDSRIVFVRRLVEEGIVKLANSGRRC